MSLKSGLTKKTLQRPKWASLVDLAYDAIVEAIVDQQLEPEEPLNIDSLAHQLEMSNTPVREALMRLKGERLVLQSSNRGFVVTPMLTEAEFHHLFETRCLIEVHALHSAVVEPSQIEALATITEEMMHMEPGSKYEHFKEFNRTDHEFHRILIQMSPNTFLIKAWQDLHFHLHIARLYTGVGIFDHMDASQEHGKIVNALETGDGERATGLLEQHIKHAEKRLIALFNSQLSKS